MEDNLDFEAIEKKWQHNWENKKVFNVSDKQNKNKFFLLEMYPYPSASGLHMGHAFNYTIGDIYVRFKRMKGFNVLYPTGYDSFGLPAENAAIKEKTHPKIYTERSISNFIKQQKSLGLSYDWSRVLWSHNPEYYRWNQFFFLQFLKKGLAYRKKSPVNWCPKCKTVLANEQVHNGKCWRHGDADVQVKNIEQWFLKTKVYAEELLSGIDKLEWPEKIKTMQKNWIGKSKGVEIDFEIRNPNKKPNLIIVHGWGGSSQEPWFKWVKRNYLNKFNVIIPNLPNSSNPKKNSWLTELEKYKDKIDGDTILIGYSLGCPTICKFLEKNNLKVGKLILIAPSPTKINSKDLKLVKKLKASEKEINSLKEYLFELNLDLKKIKFSAKKIIIYISKDDPYLIDFNSRLEDYSDLEAELKIFENKGHFNLESGVTKISELEMDLRNTWSVFTTRPDTLFGVTFMVVSAQHPELYSLVTKEQKTKVEEFLKKIRTTSKKNSVELEKEGVFTGSYSKNPLTNEEVPIYAGNFVISDYGSGMVMAVPAHDQRDFDFAQKYKIPIKTVIKTKNPEKCSQIEDSIKPKKAYVEEGFLINSGNFSGLNNKEAIKTISEYLENNKKGKTSTHYKLRDWLISRQRYWGTPIPIIYCKKCGLVPVPEKDLPVLLPEKIKFGKGNPLKTNEKFLNVKCPQCSSNSIRETDTMDTFFDSSWYFLRFCSNNKNKNVPFEKRNVTYWMPVDQYIGGAEHACMHLIYARFFTKALRDLGFIKIDEPFKKLFNQGMLYGLDGYVMSKSRGNVVLPQNVSKKYGMDTARIYLVSIASPDKDIQWSEEGINGSLRFIRRVIEYFNTNKFNKTNKKINPKTEYIVNKLVRFITEDIEGFRYNLAVINIRKLFDYFFNEKIGKNEAELMLKILHPFCPHITEELWHKIGNKDFICLQNWPKYKEIKINEKFEREEKILENLIRDLNNIFKIFPDKRENSKKIFIYCLPQEKESYIGNIPEIESKFDLKINVFSVTDKEKYDPENKSKKIKPGKPGIYIE